MRVDIKSILSDPEAKKDLFVRLIIVTQAREGITNTLEQAEQAYDLAQVAKG